MVVKVELRSLYDLPFLQDNLPASFRRQSPTVAFSTRSTWRTAPWRRRSRLRIRSVACQTFPKWTGSVRSGRPTRSRHRWAPHRTTRSCERFPPLTGCIHFIYYCFSKPENAWPFRSSTGSAVEDDQKVVIKFFSK